MFGFFKRGSKNKTLTEEFLDEFRSVYDPAKNEDRIGLALNVMIGKCLSIDNLEVSSVPVSHPFTSTKCLGSIAGLCAGIIEGEGITPEGDDVFDTIEAAMMLFFGREAAYDLTYQIVALIKSGDQSALDSYEFSRKDAMGVYQSGSLTSWAAYHLALHDMI